MTIAKKDFGWEFENHKFRKAFPSDIVAKETVNEENYTGFLLTLAVIFNDLKGLAILNDTFSDVYRKPTENEVSAHGGEYAGLQLQLFRILCATLHEFFEFLEKSRDTFESREIQEPLRATSEETQEIWSLLSAIAQRKTDGEHSGNLGELAALLKQARNNVGFHYQTKKRLLAGYRRFFYGDTRIPQEAREWAYWSGISTSFSDMRFYYGDAALQGYFIELFGDEETTKQQAAKAFDLLGYITKAISHLLLKHHESLPNR